MKVYRVEVTRTLLVMAEDKETAEALAMEEERDCDPEDVHAVELNATLTLYDGEVGTLVYHEGHEDITVEQALARCT